MGIYVDHKLMNWFIKEYPNYSKQKLDMGKSCIRFKKIDQIPFELIGKLCKKMTVNKWINIYEKEIKKSGEQDSNLRPRRPKRRAITGLRYTPID